MLKESRVAGKPTSLGFVPQSLRAALDIVLVANAVTRSSAPMDQCCRRWFTSEMATSSHRASDD